MGRRSIALALALLTALGLLGRAAHAEESGLWEAERRAGLGAELKPALREIFVGKPRLYWNRGPVFETEKKALAIHVGYEGQFDAVWYGGMDPAVEAAANNKWMPGANVRRSRIGFEMFFLRNWFVRARYGVAGIDELVFQDLFVEWSGLTHLPGSWWPILRVGQVKEAMTLDWMNNALRTTFAERAMFTTTTVPNRNLGVRAHGIGPKARFAYQLGWYVVDSASFRPQEDGSGQSVTGRLTGLPWAPADRPNHLLHVGFSGSWRWDSSEVQYEAKPESWVGPNVIDTGVFAANSGSVVAGEIFYKRDRLSFTAEGAWTRSNLPGGDSADFWGAYGQVSYFLTPGHVTYNRLLGCYGRVRPKREMFCPARKGLGDFELAARYSFLDLNAGPSPGGEAWNVTLALNWYARDNLRVQFNYVYTDVKDAYGVVGADGTMNTLLVRLAYDL